MSELLVNTIKKADGTGSLTVPAESGTVVTTASPSLGRRNLIINGAMQVAQRGTSVTGVTSTSNYLADRFFNSISGLGTWTLTQDSDAPSGFSKSIKFNCTTGDASPAAGDFIILQHRIEAQDIHQLDYGSADAKTFTFSFYVKSNKTGAASIEFMQSDNGDKQYTTSYTINSANTWERKTITVSGDASGIIGNDNGRGFEIVWWLNSGSTFTSGSLSNAWQTQVNADRNPSNLGVGGATSDYFAITGVQLEVGSVATPFEHRSYGEELALCQRYCQVLHKGVTTNLGIGYFYDTNYFRAAYTYPTTMRATPSVTVDSATDLFRILRQGASITMNTLNKTQISRTNVILYQSGVSGASGVGCELYINGAYDPYIYIEAEL